jgi:hypothetical protein
MARLIARDRISLHTVAATKLGAVAMGRPPIGKAAMTSTERSRRYRAGLATKPAATKPATKSAHAEPPPRFAATLYDLLSGYTEAITRPELKAHIVELEQERDRYKQTGEHCDAALRQASVHFSRARNNSEKLDAVLEAKDQEIAQ